MKKLLLLLASVGLFAVGCQNNLTDETIGGSINDGTTITVSLNDTRISLGEKDGDSYPVYWSEGDKITINGVLSEEAQINAENKASATFQFSKALSHPLHITYPYCASTTAETPIVEFPAEQTYAEGTFASGYAPMCGYAESKSNAISLNHLAGVLRFPVIAAREGVVLEKVVITSQNNIAGEFAVDCQNATISATEDCGNTVTYTLPANYTLSTTTLSEFFITLPAVELGACTIEFVETSGGKMVANWSMNKPLPQGIVREFKTVTYQQKSTISLQPFTSEEDELIIEKPKQPNNKIWYTSTDGNIVTPYATDVFGANIVSNTYENGQGIIKFDAPITSIGDYAFKDCSSLKSITIPNSVASIGIFTFNNCSSLTSIIIPDSVTEIGEQAFLSCSSLTSVTIPNSITSIGIYTFKYCSSLTSVTIPDSITSIGDYAFACCSSLKAFYGKFASADNRCLIIDGVLNSFAPAGLTEYVIPDSVTSIGGQAFLECSNLKSVTIPNSVTSIREHAFRSSSLTSVTIPDRVTSIGERAFYICNSLTSVTIGDSVTSIGKDAFRECSSLTSATIGNSVTEIGVQAFFSCSSLTSVIIPDSATLIGDYAFKKCSSLTSVTIGNSIISIGKGAFDVCSSLTSVYCKPTTPPAGGQYMFDQSAFGRKIYVPYNSVNTYKQAEYWSRYASDIVGYDFEIGEVVEIKPNNEIWYTSTDGNIVTPYATDGFGANIVSNTYENGQGIIKFDAPITSIGEYAFYKRTRLSSVTIPYGVTWIGWEAFRGCSNLASVTIPNSVTWIGEQAFLSCGSLKGVYISDITAWCYIYFATSDSNPLCYAHNLYLNNKLVTDLIIPDSATAISQYAFINCSNLTSITIGNSVTEIEKAAFDGCKGKLIINSRRVVEGNYLTSGYHPSSKEGWLSGAMFTSVTIGNDITSIGDYVFYDCSSLTSVTIGNSVTSIGYYAFENCTSLTSVHISDIAAWCNISINIYGSPLCYANLYLNNKLVTNVIIPDGVTRIGKGAFAYCQSLKTITIPSSVTVIGANAFRSCRNLASVTIPNSVADIGDFAFAYCTILASVYCKPTTPPHIGDYVFNYNKDGRYIYVPSASLSTYKNASGWSGYESSIRGYNYE